MSTNNIADDTQGKELLRAMSTTITQKIASCAAHVLLEEGATILDAGCADGLATAWFAQNNPGVHVIGLDYDATFIAKAQQQFGNIPNLEFIQADLRNFDLAGRPLNAILNLSILHEPYSYTGYREKTVQDILAAELKNLSPGGILINRDFMLPDNPEQFVYLALEDNSEQIAHSDNDPEKMSYPELLQLYAREAMAFDNGDPEGHIKGFFLEEHSQRIDKHALGIPLHWRVFYLPHGFAWEFIWRKEYKSRFYPEANEKYGYWTSKQHRLEAEKLGCRVLFSAPYENPWIMQNWYQPKAKIFDKNFQPLPLPASNFIAVIQKADSKASFFLREHRQIQTSPSFLHTQYFLNKFGKQAYDMVKRPGSDVVDVLPWQIDSNDQLIVFAKCDYPRPIANTQPRRMTANLDGKVWSGHMIEPLAAAPTGDWLEAVKDILLKRAEFSQNDLGAIEPALRYYTAPAELNECVQSVFVKIRNTNVIDRPLRTRYSGFSHDGSIRRFNAQRLLQAIQVGMLAEARLELNIYNLLRSINRSMGKWLGSSFSLEEAQIAVTPVAEAFKRITDFKVFEEVEVPANWLTVVRSEFHERQWQGDRERVLAKRELEFVVPNPQQSADVSTNSITIAAVFLEASTKKVVIALQKVTEQLSQFPAVQARDGHSGHITVPGFRLPAKVDHIQAVPSWVAEQIGVQATNVIKLGESYFPSLGVLPNRIFPFVVTELSPWITQHCDFYYLEELFEHLNSLRDAHTMIAICRLMHALGLQSEL